MQDNKKHAGKEGMMKFPNMLSAFQSFLKSGCKQEPTTHKHIQHSANRMSNVVFFPSPGITLYQAIPYIAPFVSAYIHANTILILCLPVLVLGKIIHLAFRLKNSTPKILKRDSLSNRA